MSSRLKKPLFYAIVRQNWGRPTVIAVTTEKARGGWHGRHVSDNTGTHGRSSDIMSRHTTQPEAESRVAVMATIEEQRRALTERLNRASSRLHALTEEWLRTAATGAVPPPLPTLDVLWSDRGITARQVLDTCDHFIRVGDCHHGDFERDVVALLERHTP
jgi:hypothetical protein